MPRHYNITDNGPRTRQHSHIVGSARRADFASELEAAGFTVELTDWNKHKLTIKNSRGEWRTYHRVSSEDGHKITGRTIYEALIFKYSTPADDIAAYLINLADNPVLYSEMTNDDERE